MRWTDQGPEWPQEVLRLYQPPSNGPWRIEESPTEERTNEVFVHVLFACRRKTPQADEVTETSQRDFFQQNAPSTEEGYYLVPKVIE